MPYASGLRPTRQLSRAFALALAAAIGLAACTQGTGLGLNVVPEEEVQQMGLEAWQKIKSETPASGNAGYQQTAERVAGRILSASGRDPDEWEVVVFEGEQVNAFALPGRKIGVYEGMFAVADSDAKLAAVLAHEVAHVDAHHSAQRVNTQMATELGTQLISAALGAANVAPPETTARLLGVGAQYGVVMPYSRNQESEADSIGLRYMAQAGYDPNAAVALWRAMAAQGGSPPAFLSTHPAPGQRAQALEAQLPEAMEIYRANR